MVVERKQKDGSLDMSEMKPRKYGLHAIFLETKRNEVFASLLELSFLSKLPFRFSHFVIREKEILDIPASAAKHANYLQ